MSAAADAFEAYVDELATALSPDQPQGPRRTDDLAARVGLSRSHLSRLVAAVAGEAPSVLCRRLLLERAAYVLATTGASVLDVALECGYGSQEAFTRAFARAYGAPPARWRRAPTRLQIDAPNGVHFHPPGSLLLPARRKVDGMDLVVRMIEHHVWLTEQMLERAERLSDTVLDRPIEISVEGIDAEPSLRRLLDRLVGQLEMWAAAIDGRAWDWPEGAPSVMGLRRRLKLAGPELVGQVRALCAEGRLDEAVVCPGEYVEVYTYAGVVAHVLTYAAHRRTLVAGALHDAGCPDLDDDPVRWISAAT